MVTCVISCHVLFYYEFEYFLLVVTCIISCHVKALNNWMCQLFNYLGKLLSPTIGILMLRYAVWQYEIFIAVFGDHMDQLSVLKFVLSFLALNF